MNTKLFLIRRIEADISFKIISKLIYKDIDCARILRFEEGGGQNLS